MASYSRPRTTPLPSSPQLKPVNTGGGFLSTLEDIPGVGQLVALFDPSSGGTVGGLANKASGAADKALGIPNVPQDVTNVANTVEQTAASAVSDVGTFLKFIAWIFTPINLLKIAVGATGILFFTLGLAFMAKSSSGRSSSGVVRQFVMNRGMLHVERERTHRHGVVERERTTRQLQVEEARTRRKTTKAA